jgi:hypothetical protein
MAVNMSLKSCAGEDSKKSSEIRRRQDRADKVRACKVQSVVSIIFEAAEMDRRLIDCSTLHVSAELLVRRLIFVSDVDLKATRVASVLLAPAID